MMGIGVIIKRALLGGIQPMTPQLWREMAHLAGLHTAAHDRSDFPCHRLHEGWKDNVLTKLHCQYRYPSPRRSGPFGFRPTPLSAQGAVDLCQLETSVQKTLVLGAQSSDSAMHNTKQKKGSILCNLSVLSSLLPRLAHFPHVSTVTSSVASRVPQLAPLSQTAQVATPSQAPSLVAQLARFVTKSRASAAKTNASFGAHPIFLTAVQGFPVRRFCIPT